MIRYTAALSHAVILARPKPKSIQVNLPRQKATGYANYSNCIKACELYAFSRGLDRTDFRIVRSERSKRYRFIER